MYQKSYHMKCFSRSCFRGARKFRRPFQLESPTAERERLAEAEPDWDNGARSDFPAESPVQPCHF